MNPHTSRNLFVAGLLLNVIFLGLALVDYAAWESRNMWPIFTGWAFIIVLLMILAYTTSHLRVVSVRGEDATPVLARAVATLASRPTAPAPTPVPTPVVHGGPFVFNGYTLHSRKVELKGDGGSRDIYFFAKSKPKSGSPVAKPAGYHVGVNERTGLPFLKKGSGKDGEDLTPALPDNYRPQCSALTAEGAQCRSSARENSKYCISHFGYQPPTMAKAAALREDTRPAVRGAADTKPTVRKAST